jgi:hypothetical protein
MAALICCAELLERSSWSVKCVACCWSLSNLLLYVEAAQLASKVVGSPKALPKPEVKWLAPTQYHGNSLLVCDFTGEPAHLAGNISKAAET